MVTGNCWDHRENLSKLKDADFQQLINRQRVLLDYNTSFLIEMNSVFIRQVPGLKIESKKLTTLNIVQSTIKKMKSNMGGTIFNR